MAFSQSLCEMHAPRKKKKKKRLYFNMSVGICIGTTRNMVFSNQTNSGDQNLAANKVLLAATNNSRC